MSEFKGRAGTIYIRKGDSADGNKYQVWFEDFCILGTGNTELEALKAAVAHVADIGDLLAEAIGEKVAQTVGVGG